MNTAKLVMIIFMNLAFINNHVFGQSNESEPEGDSVNGLFNKKNCLTYISGILNCFYDENPTYINLYELKNLGKPLRGSINRVLIKSRALSLTHHFNEKSNITLIGGEFYGFFSNNGLITNNRKFPIVTSRIWNFVSLEYNRFLFEKSNIKLYYRLGVKYRKGFEYYDIYDSFEGTRVQNLGVIVNMNIRYDFGKRYFFHSKIDVQGQLYRTKNVKDDFKRLNDKWVTREFKSSYWINHTLTIGVGIDF